MKPPRRRPVLEALIQSRVRLLQAHSPVVAASLVPISKHCGREGCPCQTGEKHVGHYLTFKVAGKTKTVYVPQDLVEEVGKWVQEHKRLRKLVQEISRLSVERIQGHVLDRQRRRGRPETSPPPSSRRSATSGRSSPAGSTSSRTRALRPW